MKISDFTIIFSRVFSGNKRELQIEEGENLVAERVRERESTRRKRREPWLGFVAAKMRVYIAKQ